MPHTFQRQSLPILLALLLALAGCGGGFGAPKRGSSGPAHRQPGPSYSVESSGGGRSSGAAHSTHATAEAPAMDSSGSDAPSPRAYEAEEAPDRMADDYGERPGLGTTFGERRHSRVERRRFERASRSPFAQVALYYNDLEGVQEQAWYRSGGLRELRAQTQYGGISVSLLDERGHLLQGGSAGGRTYVVGRDGERYTMSIRNDTGGYFEVVASVDGLDVIDGKAASFSKRGYILAPYTTLTIEGFRTSDDTVAAFRFGSVRNSYAARSGDDRNVGVIGLAFFAERGSPWTTDELRRRESADPFPGRYARPPGRAY